MTATANRRGAAPHAAGPRVADLLGRIVGEAPPVRIEAYDGSALGPDRAAATVRITSPDAFQRLVTAPGQLGLARAFATGAIDLDGDIEAALALRHAVGTRRIDPRTWLAALRLAVRAGWHRLPPLAEEAHLRGRRHSRARDAAAIAHHYDLSNDFYRLLLGPTMTYSCAVWSPEATSLELAQEAKYELICRKLGLRPGMRLLDIGCGWGGMVLHAARHHGVDAVGVTLSRQQGLLARERIAAAGLADRVEIRLQDYRDIDDGPFDAISSIGMYEHVGRAAAPRYFAALRSLLAPAGRVVNHGITRPPGESARIAPRSFMARYIFPDGELLEVGDAVSLMQEAGLEARHVESLREHYAATLRAWRANLEARWDEAVELVGAARARIWRLYLAGCAIAFDEGIVSIHQVLGVATDAGRSGFELRPDWEARPLVIPPAAAQPSFDPADG